MTQDTVKVIFRVDRRKNRREVMAFFPELPGTNRYHYDCLGYAHMGQHGAFTLDYYQEETRPARPDEYADLKAELESIGYVLQVAERMTRQDQDKRKAAIKASYTTKFRVFYIQTRSQNEPSKNYSPPTMAGNIFAKRQENKKDYGNARRYRNRKPYANGHSH